MAFVTSRAAAFEAALVTALQGRAGLAGVLVDSGPLGASTDGNLEYIEIGGSLDAQPTITSTEVWGLLGNARREETVAIDCLCFVQMTGNGGAVIRAASARAHVLLAEVATQLRDTPDMDLDNLRVTQFSEWTEQRFAGSGTRASAIRFQVTYTASLPRT